MQSLSLVVFFVGAMSGDDIIKKVVDADPYGLSNAQVSIRMLLKGKTGSTSELHLSSQGYRYDPPRSKVLARFSAPPDLAGAAFLQIQKASGDDERHLFLPEIKKARRIGGNLRSNAFMGTDFSYADMDLRDLRESSAKLLGEETMGKFSVYHIEVSPRETEAVYSKMELWVDKATFFAIELIGYDKAGAKWKSLKVKEVAASGAHRYVKHAEMTDEKSAHTTKLIVEKINFGSPPPDSEFTVRNLEKL